MQRERKTLDDIICSNKRITETFVGLHDKHCLVRRVRRHFLLSSVLPTTADKFPKCVERSVNVRYICFQQEGMCTNVRV